MQAVISASEQQAEVRDRRTIRIEAAILLTAAGAIAATLFLHFLRPHGDFYEFRESGLALLSARLPETTKRGPVFPILIAVMGRFISLFPARTVPADQLAAAVLNAALLPANVLLVYFAARGWHRGAGPWAALAAMIAPQAWLASAHVLVEPLLGFLFLLTMVLARRGSRWAYVCAGIAAITRYDLAGLLVGVAIADRVRDGSVSGVLRRSAMALVPLASWLAVTAWTWPTHSRDHYLEQIRGHAESGALRFDPVWAVRAVLSGAGASVRPGLPIWATDLRPLVETGAPAALTVLFVVGAVTHARRRDGGMVVALIAVCTYVAVHALFPFKFERFGYPPALCGIAVAAAGGAALLSSTYRGGAAIGGTVIAFGLILVAAMAAWEVDTLWAIRLRIEAAEWIRYAAALAAVLGVWCAAMAVAGDRQGGRPSVRGSFAHVLIAFGAIAAVAWVLASARETRAGLGKRQQPSALVDAARWVSAALPADARILSGVGGLLALYCDSGTERFPGFEQIAANDWDGILCECGARGVNRVLWYEGFLEEQGEYYIAKWRLQRFAHLDDGATRGLEVERRFAGDPAVVVYRLSSPAGWPASRPSDGSSSGGEPKGTAQDGGESRSPLPPRRSP
jgi:hypothetical protein